MFYNVRQKYGDDKIEIDYDDEDNDDEDNDDLFKFIVVKNSNGYF